MKFYLSCSGYEKSINIKKQRYEVASSGNSKAWFSDFFCQGNVAIKTEKEQICGRIDVSFSQTLSTPSGVAFEMEIEDWSRENYVFAPGAVYNGNRFNCKVLAYPPYNAVEKEKVLTEPETITNIPHLSKEENYSKIQLRSGDMTTPAIGFYDENKKLGILLFGPQEVGEDYTGFSIIENLEHKTAVFSLSLPAVREEVKYFFGERRDGSGFYPDARTPSDDLGKCFEEGEKIAFDFHIYQFEAENLSQFYSYFNNVRNCMETGRLTNVVPFYTAYKAIKDKYQVENFMEEGYYSVGTVWKFPQQCFQAGWIGGGMNNYAFLLEDKEEAFTRAYSTFQFILNNLQNEKGWISGIYARGIHYGDAFELGKPGSILLLRKNADLLFFLLKEMMLLEEKGISVDSYKEKIEKLADAFVRLFNKYGQIGQFIDINTEEILIGNSASSAIAVAALSLAFHCFKANKYLKTAEDLGEYYYVNYVSQGILNGGPGEICQAPDSESAFAMLEGYVQLYETTKEPRWLKYAKETFEIAITWVMSYDFHFPSESTASKRKAHTIGTVFANAQNKHSAPGICTLSGNSILKLYRFTKDSRYLDWLFLISHSITQYVSVKNRAVLTLEKLFLPYGYVNERVQTSDWEGKETIGEFLYGSNWPEVTMMLTFAEIPSVYIDFSNGIVKCFDHIACHIKEQEKTYVLAEICNNTQYDTIVNILVDESDYIDKIKHNYYSTMLHIPMKAGEKITKYIYRDGGKNCD
ncbi:hypothetical protein [Lachnoclostridium sp.]|nr:hypothetical protein [Lachnoclostridium sp.]